MSVEEVMSPGFTKHHLNPEGAQPWPFRPVLHHWSAPDFGDPHDHPWAFESFVLRGALIEERFTREGVRSVVTHLQGESYRREASDIHRIIGLPATECWTLVLYGPPEREVRFWRFDDGEVWSRHWAERDWRSASDVSSISRGGL